MENTSFVLNLSLKEMALRRVAANLWSDIDILSAVQKLQFLSPYPVFEWGQLVVDHLTDMRMKIKHDEDLQKSIHIKVKDKVSKLQLPEILKERMMHLVKPIGAEMENWKLLHEEFLYDSREFLNTHILKQLCWTSTGAVDYQKTAKKIVNVKAFDVVKLYQLACLYCLVDAIPVLWEELPNDYKEKLDVGINYEDLKQQGLEKYWAHVLSGKHSEIDCMCLGDMLDYSARMGYKEATVYFFESLKKRERKDLLMKTAFSVIELIPGIKSKSKRQSNILCYLLMQMSPEQKTELLKLQAFLILPFFLYWPNQDFFLDIADLTWTVLNESDYGQLLTLLGINIRLSGNHFPNLFQEFFVRSPHSFKKCIARAECWFPLLFFNLFHFEDTESIKTIFRNIDNKHKVKLIFSNKFMRILDLYIEMENWALVELCLREARLSIEDKNRFKDAFLECVIQYYRFQPHEIVPREPQWKQFFNFLDNTYTSTVNRRSSEDDTQTKSKKLCSQEEKDVPPRK